MKKPRAGSPECGVIVASLLLEQIELKAVMDTKVKIKPSKAAIDRALACAILSRVDGSPSIPRQRWRKFREGCSMANRLRTMSGGGWSSAILRRRLTERRCELRLGKIDAENEKGT